MLRRRKILDPLSRARLLELARAFGVGGLSGKSKDEIAGALAAERSIKTPALLDELSRDELKAVCRAAGLDDSGREKSVLIARVSGDDKVAAGPGKYAGTQPRKEAAVVEQTSADPPNDDGGDHFQLSGDRPGAPRRRRARQSTEAPASARKLAGGKRDIDQYEHTDETRINNPPVGLVTPKTDPDTGQKRKTYQYDPHLDPQLVWAGKAEHTSFEVPTVSLHVHERIDPLSIIEAVRKRNGDRAAGRLIQQSFFDEPEENPPLREAIDFYKHAHGWSNRLVAGDSLLVMNSLLEKEGMAGKVQMVYIDPPYGIKYGSNFQPFVNRRNVADGKDEDLTQEPEMICAFRDTWELGIHSYLSYLRDRLLLARELLHESGSCFVQISDENLHHVRELMDEVLGCRNCVNVISFLRGGSQTSVTGLPVNNDYVLWYAKDNARLKQRSLLVGDGGWAARSTDLWAEDNQGKRSRIPSRSATDSSTRAFTHKSIESARDTGSQLNRFQVTFEGSVFNPKRGWSTTPLGFDRLRSARRLLAIGNSLRFVVYLDDFPFSVLTNNWSDTIESGFAADKRYVVQTAARVIERCVQMTTDTGDLVVDPTCGSGTTAYVAERWGRRWITCDTSRVAITLAKQRLMTAVFDYYELAHDDEGIGSGFKYKTVPHVTLKSIANNPEIREGMTRAEIDAAIARNAGQETLYDQPFVDKRKVRVTGPFTVEAVPAPAVRPIESGQWSVDSGQQERTAGHWPLATDHSVNRRGESLRQTEWRDELLKCGIRGRGGQRIEFSRLEPLGGTRWLQCVGDTKEVARDSGIVDRKRVDSGSGSVDRTTNHESRSTIHSVVVSFGPEHAPLEQRQVENALEEATRLKPAPTMVVFTAFQFDPEAAKDIDETNWPGVTLLKVQMNTDLLTDDLKKKRSSNESYWLIGQPDVELRQVGKGEHKGQWEVEVRGFDYYNPRLGAIESGDSARIAMWLLDTDYDGRSLFPRQVFFPMAGEKDGWARLARNLKAEINEDLIESYRGTVSLPFERGEHQRVAVKIVDDRGIESLKIVEML